MEAQGWRIVIVHMSHDAERPPLLQGVAYNYVDHVNDPHCELYRSFGLSKGTWWQLLGFSVWIAGVKAMLKGHRGGWQGGDGLQMPGAFLISDERIIASHQAEHVADHPDLDAFAAAAKS